MNPRQQPDRPAQRTALMLPAFPVEQEYQPLVRLATRGQQFDPLELLCILGRTNRSMEDFLRDVARLQRSLDGSVGDLPFPPPRPTPMALACELFPNAVG